MVHKLLQTCSITIGSDATWIRNSVDISEATALLDFREPDNLTLVIVTASLSACVRMCQSINDYIDSTYRVRDMGYQ